MGGCRWAVWLSALSAVSFWMVAAIGSAGPAHAAQVNAGARKIIIAGRQRMLLGRAAKAACFATIGIDVPRHVAQLQNLTLEFRRNHAVLSFGSGPLGFPPESSPDVLRALRELRESWNAISPSIETIVAEAPKGADTSAALAKILKADRTTIGRANVLATALEAKYADSGATPLLLAAAINVAERQSLLSQRLAMRACVAAAGVPGRVPRPFLMGDVALFESSQVQLSEKLVNLPLPEHVGTFMRTLATSIAGSWRVLKPQLSQIPPKGSKIPAEYLRKVAQETETLLDKLDIAVGAYESAIAPTLKRQESSE